jgi:hypothetical protein
MGKQVRTATPRPTSGCGMVRRLGRPCRGLLLACEATKNKKSAPGCAAQDWMEGGVLGFDKGTKLGLAAHQSCLRGNNTARIATLPLPYHSFHMWLTSAWPEVARASFVLKARRKPSSWPTKSRFGTFADIYSLRIPYRYCYSNLSYGRAPDLLSCNRS